MTARLRLAVAAALAMGSFPISGAATRIVEPVRDHTPPGTPEGKGKRRRYSGRPVAGSKLSKLASKGMIGRCW